MKLNRSYQTMPTMKPKILQDPDDIVATLKAFYVENHVANFEDSKALYFSFRTAFANTGFHIHAEMAPPAPRLNLVTVVLDELRPSKEECLEAANLLNNLCHFVSVTVLSDAERFALRSVLVVSDEGCLRSQIEPFATAHMAGVAQVGSLLGSFARLEINLERLELELGTLAQQGEEAEAQDTPANEDTPNAGRRHFEQN